MFFAEAIGGDLAPKLAGGDEGHFQWPGYYLLALSLLIFPATYALPAAARLAARTIRAPRTDEANSGLRFLLTWIIPSFLVFELLPTKLPHYTLPVYPALALLGAAALATAAQERWRITQIIGFTLFALAGAALIVLTAYGATFMPGDVNADARRATQTIFLGLALALPALALLFFLKSQAAKAAVAIAFALIAAYGLRERIMPEARTLLVSHAVSSVLDRANWHPRLSENARPLWIIGYGEASLVFETATSVRIAGPETVAAGANVGDIVVVEQRWIDELNIDLAARNLVLETSNSVAGLNYANGDDVVLLIGRITDTRAT